MQYSTQQTFNYLNSDESHALLVKTNGGNLVIDSWDGKAWVTADTITADGVSEYFTKGQRLRFTPSGGCTFKIDKGY
jgi:hypothetical protein